MKKQPLQHNDRFKAPGPKENEPGTHKFSDHQPAGNTITEATVKNRI